MLIERRAPEVPPAAPPAPRASDMIFQLLAGKWISRALSVAAELGVADVMESGPRSAEELALAVKADAPSLRRVLRALAAVGIFTEDGAGRFALTALGEPLRTRSRESMRAMARMVGLRHFAWEPWAAFEHSVRTGEPAFDHVHGCAAFDYLAAHADEAAVFHDAMSAFSGVEAEAIVAAWGFADEGTVVDVGGGHGLLLSTILSRRPRLRGILYDRPEVVAGAPESLRTGPLGARLEIRGGDFFQSVPQGADVYMMKHIVHDWGDGHCLALLRNCREAMNPGGRLLVIDMVIPRGNDPHPGKFLDLEMLAMTRGGRERTAAEFESLFRTAGFEVARVVPTASPVSIVEGVRA
jgi:hypothetical protein